MPGSSSSSRALPSPAYGWAVLLCVSLAQFGGYYLYDSLGMVADWVLVDHHLRESQYGLLSGTYGIAGALALLVGGHSIDRLGTKRSILVFALITTLAGIVTAITSGFWGLQLGRFLLGLGAEPLSIAVSTTLARYWKGRAVAFAFGLNLTLCRLGTVAANRSPQWAASAYASGTSAVPLRLAALIGCVCLLAAICNHWVEQRAERRFDLPVIGTTDKLTVSEIRSFDHRYWLLVGVCVAFYAIVFPFQSFATKLLMEGHGVARDQAGAVLSYLPASAMVAAPLFGALVDRVGRRTQLLFLGLLLSLPVFPLLAISEVSPTGPILLLCVSFSLIPAVLWPSVSLVVPEKRLATAYSLMTLLQQLAVWALSAALGFINEASLASEQHPAGYAPGMWLLAGLAAIGVLCGFLLLVRKQQGSGAGL